MKKRPKKYMATYIWTIPLDLIAWIIVLVAWLLLGTRLHWIEGLWCELKQKPANAISKIWRKQWGGVTLGHGGLLRPGAAGGEGIDTKIERHEHVHVEQYEASMLVSFIIAIAVLATIRTIDAAILAGAIWITGGVLPYVASLLQAWLRGEQAYGGSHLEEAARAQE